MPNFSLSNNNGTRSSHQRNFMKKLFLKILQNLQENTCVRVFALIKLQALKNTFFMEKSANIFVFI